MACGCAVTRRTLIRPAGVHWPTLDSQLDVPVQLCPIPLARAQWHLHPSCACAVALPAPHAPGLRVERPHSSRNRARESGPTCDSAGQGVWACLCLGALVAHACPPGGPSTAPFVPCVCGGARGHEVQGQRPRQTTLTPASPQRRTLSCTRCGASHRWRRSSTTCAARWVSAGRARAHAVGLSAPGERQGQGGSARGTPTGDPRALQQS